MKNIKEFYQEKFKGSLFVVKAGGRIITNDQARESLLEDIQDLTNYGMKVLLIYGGGQAITAALKEAGLPLREGPDGMRLTGPKEIKIIQNVMAGDLGYRLSATMTSLGLNGLCLSSIPSDWVDIALKERENPEDFGYGGFIRDTFEVPIYNAFKDISFIACPCIGISERGGININADNVAVSIAAGCKARKLIFLSDVDGVKINGETAPFITDKEIPELIASGTVSGGMAVKLENCLYALGSGVRRIHLLDGFRSHAVSQEVYESEGPATMIIKEEDRQKYLDEIETQKSIEGIKRKE